MWYSPPPAPYSALQSHLIFVVKQHSSDQRIGPEVISCPVKTDIALAIARWLSALFASKLMRLWTRQGTPSDQRHSEEKRRCLRPRLARRWSMEHKLVLDFQLCAFAIYFQMPAIFIQCKIVCTT